MSQSRRLKHRLEPLFSQVLRHDRVGRPRRRSVWRVAHKTGASWLATLVRAEKKDRVYKRENKLKKKGIKKE